MVPISRLISFASKHAPRQHSLSLLRRFSLSRNPQSRSYTKSTKHGGEKRETQHVYTIEEPQREKSYATFILPAALLGFGGLAAFLRYNDERRAIPRGETQKEQFSPGPVIGGPFSLIDTEKRVVTERDFLGKWVLLYFGYTSSPDIGPEQVKTMAETIDKLALLGIKNHRKISSFCQCSSHSILSVTLLPISVPISKSLIPESSDSQEHLVL
ncbi:unnamed protein product [Linum tenue]|uniref:Uncharacterized protein n=1 Tax=Linum tenue TaxID=586396 RepID=A0AAV0RB81_9ROSI|nr:unnamed protein product [Linum tenue]